MSDFLSYEKMPTNLKKLGLKEADFAKLEKLRWVVTEKVHGANFSFHYEDRRLKFAKRKEFLSWSDDFFGFQLVANRLEERVTSLFEELSLKEGANHIILYGELFGGDYPHPQVERNPELHPIQTGVYYSPDISFCAFDLAISGPNAKFYLDYETTILYFERHQILYAKPLLIGKLKEALNFNTRINSRIPAELGLPELESNLIEGVVVKPFNLSDPGLLSTRPIVKLKNKELEEEERFHEAKKWSFIPEVNSKTEDLSYILDDLKRYITRNRLQSAISKIGEPDPSNEKRQKEIIKEFLADTMEDFKLNNPGVLEELIAEEISWLEKRAESEIELLLSGD